MIFLSHGTKKVLIIARMQFKRTYGRTNNVVFFEKSAIGILEWLPGLKLRVGYE